MNESEWIKMTYENLLQIKNILINLNVFKKSLEKENKVGNYIYYQILVNSLKTLINELNDMLREL